MKKLQFIVNLTAIKDAFSVNKFNDKFFNQLKNEIMKTISVLFVLVLLVACKQEKIDTAKEGEELMQLSRAWSKSAATDNIDQTLSYWSNDAIFISPGQPTLKGKESLKNMVESSSKIPGFSINWEPIHVSISECGDMGYMIEKNVISMNDSLGNPVTTSGRVVTIWKKNENGEWKNVLEISTDDPK